MIYSHLCSEQKEIRVLTVEPGDVVNHVVCTLRNISLLTDSIPQYEAVSYAWGSDRATKRPIILDGAIVNVPATTEEALRYLRFPNKPRVLWIDAVCTAQHDLKEESHQAALTGEVYSKARVVLVWLGKSDVSTASAFSSVELMYQRMCEETAECARLREVLYGGGTTFLYSLAKLPQQCDWDSITALFARTWFRRLWVVQEATLPAVGVVQCGDLSIWLKHLIRVATWIQHRRYHVPDVIRSSAVIAHASVIWKYADHEQGRFAPQYSEAPVLANLLFDFELCEVSEARDRVFTLLGLTQWAQRSDRLPLLLRPNYSKSVHDVLRDASRAAIYEMRELHRPWYIEHCESVPKGQHSALPSWVPPSLYRRLGSTTSVQRLATDDSHGYVEATEAPQKFNPDTHEEYVEATKALGAIPASNEDHSDVLLLLGFEVDEHRAIEADGDIITDQQVRDAHSLTVMLVAVLLHGSLGKDGPRSLHERLTTNELLLVLVGGNTQNLDRTHDVAASSSRSTFNALANALDQLRRQNSSQSITEHEALRGVQHLLEAAEYMQFAFNLSNACSRRRLFTISTRIGLGPPTAQPGDIVCDPSDSPYPMVLRHDQKDYNLVGPCYVHGVMKGEAIETHHGKGAQFKTFAVR